MEIRYFESKYAKQIHDYIINETGGLSGTKDPGRLESVLEHLQHDLYYPTFTVKLSRLVFALSKFHMFNDGNKRSSISLGSYFLNINGYSYCSDTFIIEMENIVLWVAQDLVDEELLSGIMESIITENCLNEDIKLKLAMLLQNIDE